MNGVKEIEDDIRVYLKVVEDYVFFINIKVERGDVGRYRFIFKNVFG